ncbi:conjugal transfer protein [Salmonella enterica]|nr:conjugal transfer protein [Salmonella enterica]
MISFFEDVIEGISRNLTSNDSLKYCDLTTVVGLTSQDRVEHPEIRAPYILTTKNNDFLTVIEVQGAKSSFDEKSFNDFIMHLSNSLSNSFINSGHKLSVVFERDFTKNQEELNNVYKPQVAAIERLQIDIKDLIADDAKKIAAHYSRERAYIVLYTSKGMIAKDELKNEQAKAAGVLKDIPQTRFSQNPIEFQLEGLKITHDAMLWRLIGMLQGDDESGMGLLVDVLDVKHAGAMMRQMLFRNSTSENWYPRTPFDQNLRVYGAPRKGNIDSVLPPRLNIQIMEGELEEDGGLIYCDGKYYGSVALELPPLHPVKFKQLFNAINRKIPYRIKYDFMGGGKKALFWPSVIISFLRFIPSLGTIARDMDYVGAQSETDPTAIMAINFATWGDTKDEAKRNLAALTKAIEGWGVSGVSRTYGNPGSALIASVPGLTTATPGSLHYPPLSEGLRMLPFERPASPWHGKGNINFITLDGKLFPYQIASPLQEKFTDVITGVPGSGKSVLANRLNLSAIYRADKKLPYLTIIDKGYSAKGIADLIRAELPAEQRHQIASITLNNDESHCINICDTQLGSRYLTQFEEVFLKQMLNAFCIDPAIGQPPDAMSVGQIVSKVVSKVYKAKAHSDANKFKFNDPVVNEALKESGLDKELGDDWFEKATWWEVVDKLFAKKYLHAATVAQRYAVPTIYDFISELQTEGFSNQYADVKVNGSEPVVNFVARCFQAAAADYAIFSGITVYDFSPETRIAILDMQNVLGDRTTPAGKLKSGIMYLFARQMAVRNYYLPQSAETFIPALPEQYRAYHQARIRELTEEVKHTFYDECHNFAGIDFIQNALNTADLEDRKFNVRTAFSSQYLSHMPSSVLKTMNSLFMMRLTEGDEEYLKQLEINIPADILRRFRQLPQGVYPDGSGTAFLGIFKTKRGLICHILKNTLGPKLLWALNSSAKDRALRDVLYEELGTKKAREELANRFPMGSASSIIDEMVVNQGGERDSEEESQTMAMKLAKEIISDVRRGFR